MAYIQHMHYNKPSTPDLFINDEYEEHLLFRWLSARLQ